MLALRAKIQEHTLEFLQSKPQYAYTPQRAIDEAIGRVSRHCRAVRERLQASVVSVHARRAGQKPPSCQGGAMLSMDLSRAFDSIPREALQRALCHAGVPEPLQQAVLQLHERCLYRVRHKGYSQSFNMRIGIRQGCVLSPYLYALFTCIIFDEIARRTDSAWAATALTLFADDSHVAWTIDSVEDLRFLMHSIQVTFQVFKEFGMVVHPGKSQLVIKLRGSAATRWLRKHTHRTEQGRLIEVGEPHRSIRLPRVHSMQYLGIVASYSSFELQTCAHRIKAAIINKHRLTRVLHNRQLTILQRARVYVACVRSSLLYGQHATGATSAVLHKLEQFDSRALRAIARSPAHITKEKTVDVRARLRVDPPHSVLCKTLERRVQKVASADSREWFMQQLQEIRALCPDTTGKGTGTPYTGQDASQMAQLRPVPCPDCGLYFPTLRHMRSHQARQHQHVGLNSRRQPGVLCAAAYAAGSVGGMPQCAKCGKIFTRVEGLKKHINSGCVVATAGTDDAVAVTAGEDQVPSQRAGSPRGWALQTVTDKHVVPQSPLFESSDFRCLVWRDWRKAAATDSVKTHLKEHCLLCGQWGSRLKQHLRQMHKDAWALRATADSLCSSAGFTATDPCSYCGLSNSNPRRHNLSCIVLFQTALAKSLLEQGQHERGLGHGGRPGGACPGGAGDGAWPEGDRHGAGDREVSAEGSGGGRRAPPQVAERKQQRGQRTILQFLGGMAHGKEAVGARPAEGGRGDGHGGQSPDQGAPTVS